MPSQQPNTKPLKPSSASKHILVATNSFASEYYACFLEAVSSYLTPMGIKVYVQPKPPFAEGERKVFASLNNESCDGLIIHADYLCDAELNDLMAQHPCAVLLDRHLPQFEDRCVHVDNKFGGELAAEHLISKGHTKIAMLSGSDTFHEVAHRANGFKQVLEAQGITLQAEICGDFLYTGGAAAMEYLHREHPEVTAIFSQNDEMAFGAINLCRELNINVPHDISIVGLDGVPMCDYIAPRLTSVQKPLRQLGIHASKMVMDLVWEVEPSKRVNGCSYNPELVERETVTPPRGVEPEQATLTQRETECLTWTAVGKTSWEISVILSISESTATFHLRNAGVKLMASNRTHAVAKALHLGLIEFKTVNASEQ